MVAALLLSLHSHYVSGVLVKHLVPALEFRHAAPTCCKIAGKLDKML